jgi:hypothetical protein
MTSQTTKGADAEPKRSAFWDVEDRFNQGGFIP